MGSVSKAAKIAICGWALGASALLTPCGQAATVAGADATEIRQLLQQRVARGESVGIVVGLIDEHGAQVISAGTMRRNSDQPVNGDTIFTLASVSKTFTATLLAELVERHEINLEDPLKKFLPPSIKVPIQDGREITLLDLVTHTSGLPRNYPGYHGLDDNFTIDQVNQFLTDSTLSGKVGSTVAYSNWGFALLGGVLVRKTGLDYETLVQQRICAPLHMTSTTVTLNAEQQKRCATGYGYGQSIVQNLQHSQVMAPVGGLRSTANDMLRYVAANMNLDNPTLAPAMRDAQIARRRVKSLTVNQIGLAWDFRNFPGGTIISHGGASQGFCSFVGFVPGQRRGVVVLSNTEDEVKNLGMHILYRGIAPESDTAVYEGHYELSPGHLITVIHDGRSLITQVTGDRKVWLVSKTANQFNNSGMDLGYTFVKDETGDVKGIIIRQHGQTWQARWVSPLTPEDIVPESVTEQLSRPIQALTASELAKVAAVIGSYDGQYEIRPGSMIVVTHDGTNLVTQVNDGHIVRLAPKTVNQFVNPSLALEYTFVKNEAGAVLEVIVRQREKTWQARRITTPTLVTPGDTP